MDDRYYIEALLPMKRMPDGSLGIVTHTASPKPDHNIIRVIVDKAVADVNMRIARGGSVYSVLRKHFGASR